MSGPVRSATVRVTVEFEITDQATEGEMVDACVAAVTGSEVCLLDYRGTVDSRLAGVTVEKIRTGGHL